MTLVAAALAGLTTMLLSGPAAADTIKVPPGGSIQEAVNKAKPGDTVKVAAGTYQQNVQIKTDGITLKGEGPDETVIEPGTPPTAADPFCEGNGICIVDATPHQNGPPTVNRVIADVRVKELAVQGFTGTGVLFFGTRNQRVIDVLAQNNGSYGIAAFETTEGKYWDNVTPNNHEAGIYIGDSPNADALVRDNVSNGNLGNGIFIRDASHGVVKNNQTYDNCVGILLLDTPEPTENTDWVAHDNSVNHNNKACPATDESRAISGIGIGIAGPHGLLIRNNTVNGNQPGGPTDFSGGIVLATIPGSPATTGNRIEENSAFGNAPVDLLWDRQGVNTFQDNRCKTSDPQGLCVNGDDDGDDDSAENGHQGDNGDHGDHGDKHKSHKHHKHHKHGKHHKSSSRNKHV
jgi:nitrous oxidase accessory protein NosD